MIDTAENKDRFRALVKAMWERPLILFTGAGASIDSGYPSWDGFLETLHGQAATRAAQEGDKPKQKRDPNIMLGARSWQRVRSVKDGLWRAEFYRKTIGEAVYERCLRRVFEKRRNPGKTARLLARFNFRHCVTTNYETSLERACVKMGRPRLNPVDWTDRAQVRLFFDALEQKTRQRYIIYLHGRADKPQDMVFTDRDYINRYVLSNDSYPRLLALFMLHRFLIVGFSLTDPQFETLFQVVHAHLGADAQKGRHFMLTRTSNPQSPREDEIPALRFKQKYGIEPIFYNYDPRKKKEGDHSGLHAVLEGLARLMKHKSEKILDRVLGEIVGSSRLHLPASSLAILEAKPKTLEISVQKQKPQMKMRVEKKPFFNPDPDSDDPTKGMFGGIPRRGPYQLTASVTKTGDPDWFDIEITVRRTDRKRLDDPITFYLHPSFIKSKQKMHPRGSTITLERTAWGAFTVGVSIGKDDHTRLELDLSDLPDAPTKFRSR